MFIAHLPPAILLTARGTEQQVTWNCSFHIFLSQKQLAAYYLLTLWCYSEVSPALLSRTRLLQKDGLCKFDFPLMAPSHTESHVADSWSQTDRGP